jgi:hypothetical protein
VCERTAHDAEPVDPDNAFRSRRRGIADQAAHRHFPRSSPPIVPARARHWRDRVLVTRIFLNDRGAVSNAAALS